MSTSIQSPAERALIERSGNSAVQNKRLASHSARLRYILARSLSAKDLAEIAAMMVLEAKGSGGDAWRARDMLLKYSVGQAMDADLHLKLSEMEEALEAAHKRIEELEAVRQHALKTQTMSLVG